MTQMHQRPKSFIELFEFMRWVAAKNEIHTATMNLAKAKEGARTDG
jgi:hypothetical protein